MVDDFVSYVDFDINKCLMTASEEIAPELEKQLQENTVMWQASTVPSPISLRSCPRM